MISIQIDDKACVGCSLCVDECPTKVFSFNQTKNLPEVDKPKECFGCLSCSEICPSDAIGHDGIVLSESYYHDPRALQLAARLGSSPPALNVPEDLDRQRRALQDLGVRLLSVAAVFKQTLGGALPAVGTLAGRTLATQLPRYQLPKTLEETFALAHEQFAPAWNLEIAQADPDTLTIRVADCFVRDVCRNEKIELGGELCVLFYNYLAGYLGRMSKARYRLLQADRGWERCCYTVKSYA